MYKRNIRRTLFVHDETVYVVPTRLFFSGPPEGRPV